MYAILKPQTTVPVCFNTAVARRDTAIIEKGVGRELRGRLLQMHADSFDRENGGLDLPIKFLDQHSVEYSLVQAARHDHNEERMVRKTLDNALALIDPVWGGTYHYSNGHHWDNPHFSKTLSGQATCLHLYSLAYALFHEHHYLYAVKKCLDYMENFLLDPEGVFYAGQSDSVAGIETDLYFSLADTERRQYGLPEVNRNIRIRENGRAIEALGICYEFTGIKSAWDLAARVAGWMVDNRYAGNNGIHAHRLADVLAIGRGMLQLFRISADPRYLQYAIAMADLICSRFKGPAGGYNQTINPAHHSSAPPQVDENISTIRYLNLLSHYTGNPEYKSQAAAGFTWLAKPEVATTRIEEAGILLADEELSSNPIRITIAGHRTDPDTQGFIKTAMQLFGWYKVIHWTDIDMNVCRSGALAANNQSPRLIQP